MDSVAEIGREASCPCEDTIFNLGVEIERADVGQDSRTCRQTFLALTRMRKHIFLVHLIACMKTFPGQFSGLRNMYK